MCYKFVNTTGLGIVQFILVPMNSGRFMCKNMLVDNVDK